MKYALAIFALALVLALFSELGGIGAIAVIVYLLNVDTRVRENTNHVEDTSGRIWI